MATEDLEVVGLGKILAIKNCSNCNKETVIRNKERLNRKNIFCCKKCEGEFKSKNCNNYKPCVVCGKKVYRKPSYIINNNIHNIFCSYQCPIFIYFRKLKLRNSRTCFYFFFIWHLLAR